MSSILQTIAGNVLFIRLIGFVFSHAGFLMPGERLGETENWMAVRHPRPVYPVHILFIPRKAIQNWLSLPSDEPEMYTEFIRLSQRIIREEGLDEKGYRLIINGGVYQSIPQLHVHLVSGDQLSSPG